VFDLVARTGAVSRQELELTFNLGVGMVAAIAGDRAEEALAVCRERGVDAWQLGDIVPGGGVVRLDGAYAGPAGRW
jgi:phosphoribosylformylglycinamidine cyclo-ligase